MATGLELLKLGQCTRCGLGKVLQAEHEVPRVHQEARETAGQLVLCWGSEELEKGRASLLLAAIWSQGTLDARTGTGRAPAPSHPQGCCYGHGRTKACACTVVTKATGREHRKTLGVLVTIEWLIH